MKNIISKMSITEGVCLVTVNGISNDTSIIAGILNAISGAEISLDMIGLSPLVKGSEISLSFSLNDVDLSKTIAVIGNFKKTNPTIHTEIITGNTKFCVFGEKMPQTPGVAADLLTALSKDGIDIRLITTSDTDISLLVNEGDTDKAADAIKNEFGI